MKRFRFPFVVLMTASILVSTIGIHVHTLFCYCKGTTSVALFSVPKSECSDTVSKKESCCKKEETSHCSEESESCCVKKSHHLPCDKKDVKYFQLKTESLSPNWLKFFNPDKEVLGEVLAFYFKTYNSEKKCIDSQNYSILPDNKAPPEPFGKTLCILTENFRC